MNKQRVLISTFLCVFLTLSPPITSFGKESDPSGAVGIEYDDLRTLLKEGNLTLKGIIADQEDTINAYQETWGTMKWEQDNMEDKAEGLSNENGETSAVYSSNTSMLKAPASHIYNQAKNPTDEKSARAIKKSADSYTYAAQTLMNSYNQMTRNRYAAEKNVQALEASCQALVKKSTAGSAIQAQILSKKNSLDIARNSLKSLREQERELRFRSLTMLDLEDREDVVIGAIPAPDVEVITAIDFESGRQKTVGNDSNVQNERHTRAYGTADINRRSKQVGEAEGTAGASIQYAYQELESKVIQYQAALESYESALLIYQSLQRKQAAGLLSSTGYLKGEAAYAQKQAAKETVSMSLVQTYGSYCWGAKGAN